MASPNIYPAGIGGSSGDALTTSGTIYTSGQIWYVSSVGGTDAASPRGLDRNTPLATLAQAVTNASAGDTIVFLANHVQAITAEQAISKALTIVSEGSSSTRARLTAGLAGAGTMMTVTAPVTFGNIYFPATTGAGTTNNRVGLAAGSAGSVVRGCYFEAGAADAASAIHITSNNVTIEDTTFVVTAAAASPQRGIGLAGAVSDLRIKDCTFNASTFGWGSQYGLDLGAGAVTRLYGENVQMLNGSDATLASGSTGILNVTSPSGAVKVLWVA